MRAWLTKYSNGEKFVFRRDGQYMICILKLGQAGNLTRTTEETVEHLRSYHSKDEELAKRLADFGMEDLADKVF